VTEDARGAFRSLHAAGTFVAAEPVGPAVRCGSLRIPASRALAATNAGLAASLGRADQEVTSDGLVTHIAILTGGRVSNDLLRDARGPSLAQGPENQDARAGPQHTSSRWLNPRSDSTSAVASRMLSGGAKGRVVELRTSSPAANSARDVSKRIGRLLQSHWHDRARLAAYSLALPNNQLMPRHGLVYLSVCQLRS
jgi:hypothetical protein